jgi:hypothetical protein
LPSHQYLQQHGAVYLRDFLHSQPVKKSEERLKHVSVPVKRNLPQRTDFQNISENNIALSNK